MPPRAASTPTARLPEKPWRCRPWRRVPRPMPGPRPTSPDRCAPSPAWPRFRPMPAAKTSCPHWRATWSPTAIRLRITMRRWNRPSTSSWCTAISRRPGSWKNLAANPKSSRWKPANPRPSGSCFAFWVSACAAAADRRWCWKRSTRRAPSSPPTRGSRLTSWSRPCAPIGPSITTTIRQRCRCSSARNTGPARRIKRGPTSSRLLFQILRRAASIWAFPSSTAEPPRSSARP